MEAVPFTKRENARRGTGCLGEKVEDQIISSLLGTSNMMC